MASRPRSNDITKKAEPFIDKIESIDEQIESLKGTFMAACKAKRNLIKQAVAAAKEEGIAPGVMKGIVSHRRLQRKINKIGSGFDDIDEAADYRELARVFGPLGQAAAVRAGYGRADDGEPVPTAAEAKAAQQTRDHEAGLQTVGRGRKSVGEMMREPGGPLAGEPLKT
jgi:hypothetical protein